MCPGFCHVLLSVGVGAHCGQLAGLGTLPITNTLTAHSSCWSSLEPFLPPFWSPPCTQLRGFSQGCSSQGAEGLCWLSHCTPLLRALRSQGWCHWDLPSPDNAKPLGPAHRRAQSPRALQACSSNEKSHEGQGTYCLQASTGKEHSVRGSERKFHHTKEQRHKFWILQSIAQSWSYTRNKWKLQQVDNHLTWKQHTGTFIFLYKVSAFSVFEWQSQGRESSSLQWQFLWHPDKCPCCHFRILCLFCSVGVCGVLKLQGAGVGACCQLAQLPPARQQGGRGCLGCYPVKDGAAPGAILGQSERQFKLLLC